MHYLFQKHFVIARTQHLAKNQRQFSPKFMVTSEFSTNSLLTLLDQEDKLEPRKVGIGDKTYERE